MFLACAEILLTHGWHVNRLVPNVARCAIVHQFLPDEELALVGLAVSVEGEVGWDEEVAVRGAA